MDLSQCIFSMGSRISSRRGYSVLCGKKGNDSELKFSNNSTMLLVSRYKSSPIWVQIFFHCYDIRISILWDFLKKKWQILFHDSISTADHKNKKKICKINWIFLSNYVEALKCFKNQHFLSISFFLEPKIRRKAMWPEGETFGYRDISHFHSQFSRELKNKIKIQTFAIGIPLRFCKPLPLNMKNFKMKWNSTNKRNIFNHRSFI